MTKYVTNIGYNTTIVFYCVKHACIDIAQEGKCFALIPR